MTLNDIPERVYEKLTTSDNSILIIANCSMTF
jgi:hypothetical protein